MYARKKWFFVEQNTVMVTLLTNRNRMMATILLVYPCETPVETAVARFYL